MNLPFNIDRTLEGLTKVSLRGGIAGKVTTSIVVVSLSLAAIAWSVKNLYLSIAAIAAIFILAFVMFWRLINFANRNPQAALLEGAEFLLHEQIVHMSKSNPTLSWDAIEQVQPEPILGPSADPEVARKPDQEAFPIQENGGQK